MLTDLLLHFSGPASTMRHSRGGRDDIMSVLALRGSQRKKTSCPQHPNPVDSGPGSASVHDTIGWSLPSSHQPRPGPQGRESKNEQRKIMWAEYIGVSLNNDPSDMTVVSQIGEDLRKWNYLHYSTIRNPEVMWSLLEKCQNNERRNQSSMPVAQGIHPPHACSHIYRRAFPCLLGAAAAAHSSLHWEIWRNINNGQCYFRFFHSCTVCLGPHSALHCLQWLAAPAQQVASHSRTHAARPHGNHPHPYFPPPTQDMDSAQAANYLPLELNLL